MSQPSNLRKRLGNVCRRTMELEEQVRKTTFRSLLMTASVMLPAGVFGLVVPSLPPLAIAGCASIVAGTIGASCYMGSQTSKMETKIAALKNIANNLNERLETVMKDRRLADMEERRDMLTRKSSRSTFHNLSQALHFYGNEESMFDLPDFKLAVDKVRSKLNENITQNDPMRNKYQVMSSEVTEQELDDNGVTFAPC